MITDNKNQSKLLKGLRKVIDRQNNKPAIVKIDIGMNTYKEFKNRSTYDINKTGNYYFPLLWHPLKYVIKRTAHTFYTYSVSQLPQAKDILRWKKKRRERKRLNSIH